MHYLAVHDLVWINSTVTGTTVPFNYVRLEEAMAAQYSYGDSTHTEAQAAFLLQTILQGHPFQFGNRRTAFIGTVAFLTANGWSLRIQGAEAAELLKSVVDGRVTAQDAIPMLAQPGGATLREGVALRTLVTYLCNEHVEALKLLAEGDA